MKHKCFITCLCAMLLWVVLNLCRSHKPADASSVESRWVLVLLQRLAPFELTHHTVRKLAHFTEFSVLGVLAGALFGGRCSRWWTGLLFAAMTGVTTALCDETIQLFVPGRSGQVTDIWIDVAGASTGAAIALLTHTLRHRKK